MFVTLTETDRRPQERNGTLRDQVGRGKGQPTQ